MNESLQEKLRVNSERGHDRLVGNLLRWIEKHELFVSLAEQNPQFDDIFNRCLRHLANDLAIYYALNTGRIRGVFFSDLFPGAASLKIPISAIHEESHQTNHVDMVYVSAAAAAVKAKRFFEIGTYRGQTACALVETVDDLEVFTLNLPPELDSDYEKFIGLCIKDHPLRNRIRQIFGDSRSCAYPELEGTIDIVFVDGDHSYDLVKNDTHLALRLIKPGGIIIWHDFAAKCPGVVRFLSEFSLEKSIFWISHTSIAIYLDGVDAMVFEAPERLPSLELERFTADLLRHSEESVVALEGDPELEALVRAVRYSAPEEAAEHLRRYMDALRRRNTATIRHLEAVNAQLNESLEAHRELNAQLDGSLKANRESLEAHRELNAQLDGLLKADRESLKAHRELAMKLTEEIQQLRKKVRSNGSRTVSKDRDG